jgi:hypothetical protein
MKPFAQVAAPRFDLYAGVHKAIRLATSDMLVRLGALDADDEPEVEAVTGALAALLGQLRMHLEHENRHVHPAMEARRSGSSTQVAGEHEEHVASIDALRHEAADLVAASPAERRVLALRLYRHFALFVAENYQHMHHEETVHNAVLWETHSDEELHAIEMAIVGSQTPESLAGWMHWFAPALTTGELSPMLAGARMGMPVPAFDGLMGMVRTRLTATRYARVRAAVDALGTAQSVAA